MNIFYIVLIVLAVAAVGWWLYRRFAVKEKSILHLPLRALGFRHIPAVPIILREIPSTLLNLAGRARETKQAKAGLSTIYTIRGITANAYSFMFSQEQAEDKDDSFERLRLEVEREALDWLTARPEQVSERLQTVRPARAKNNSRQALNTISLDDPAQFAMGWTTFGNLWRDASGQLLAPYSQALTDADAATEQFWPTIALYGTAYNLLIAQKVDAAHYTSYKKDFAAQWSPAMDACYQAGTLYVIDLRIFSNFQAQEVDGSPRFTPSTFTWLEQDPATRQLKPFAVYVTGYQGKDAQLYTRGQATDSAWLYALQAAKTSVTVYGIWLGHVYHWHIVTAAMVMTMFNNVPDTHPLYQLLAPQSQYLIGFNEVLLLLWKNIAPPTSFATAYQFVSLMNTFATNRTYFSDDPTHTLASLGIDKQDFTVSKDWDAYPMAGYLLEIWAMVGAYTETFVDTVYANDGAVSGDKDLQQWIRAAGSPEGGNVPGLPSSVTSKAALQEILHSLLYRITAHGTSRLNNTANPGLSFVGNYPPCLQQTLIPGPDSSFSTSELLAYMPNTGSIGEMLTFYMTFADSVPYEPFIPLEGIQQNLFFGENKPLNDALLAFRTAMLGFMDRYAAANKIPNLPASTPQIHQWPLNIET